MTIKECYDILGADYEEVLKRMKDDARVKKFVKLYLKDPSYPQLMEAMKTKNYETAFQVAHTMKGVCKNLALTKISNSSSRLTELLRVKNIEEAEKFFPIVREDYEKTIDLIKLVE